MSESPHPQTQPEADSLLRGLELNDKTILKALAQMHKLQQEAQQRADEGRAKTETELRELRAELFVLHREIHALTARLAGSSTATVEVKPTGLIICAGMIRSGSTLQYQVVSDLVEQRGLGQRAGFVESKTFSNVRARLENADGLTVIKVHEYMRCSR